MNPTLVLDSSVALAWCFPDEMSPATDAVLLRLGAESAIVPQIWALEITNVLVIAERRGRILLAKSEEFIAMIRRLLITIDQESSEHAFEHLLPLCRMHGLTSYDAAYLELAIRTGLPLATIDRSLRTAANTLGLPLLGQ